MVERVSRLQFLAVLVAAPPCLRCGRLQPQLLDSKEFWEGDGRSSCATSPKSATDPNDEREPTTEGAPARATSASPSRLLSPVGVRCKGCPSSLALGGHRFSSGRSTTWPFDDSDLKASWKWGPGWKGGKLAHERVGV